MCVFVSLVQFFPKSCPVIPIFNTSTIFDRFQRHMEQISTSSLLFSLPGDVDPLFILPRHAGIDSHPGDPDLDGTLQILFPSLRSLSQTVQSSNGSSQLAAYLGYETSIKLAAFFHEDSKV